MQRELEKRPICSTKAVGDARFSSTTSSLRAVFPKQISHVAQLVVTSSLTRRRTVAKKAHDARSELSSTRDRDSSGRMSGPSHVGGRPINNASRRPLFFKFLHLTRPGENGR
ncbi:hypothetical protein MRX96_012170 [Rhipicephalus microplus]